MFYDRVSNSVSLRKVVSIHFSFSPSLFTYHMEEFPLSVWNAEFGLHEFISVLIVSVEFHGHLV